MCVVENGKSSSELSKGPISFSIKAKDTKKPKIEYRTSVIYKQSCEQGESDEDADEQGSDTEGQERNDTNGKQSEESIENQQQQQQTTEQAPTEDLDQQMDSIKAAERIGMKTSF